MGASEIPKDELIANISGLLGDAACTYVQNKNRGGESGKKGSRYEDNFTVFQIAKLAVDNLENLHQWPVLESQVLAFVDDLVVCEPAKTRYFQAKNVASLSWDAGVHPISTDFRHQYALSTHLAEPSPTLVLVVSDIELKKNLDEAIPTDIEPYSSVEFFPYSGGSLNRLVFECAELRDVLTPLARTVTPSFADLEGVFGVLLFGFLREPRRISVDAILRSARECIPSMLSSMNVVDLKQHITSQFVNTLASIPGLAYAFHQGFFSWTAFGTSGVFRVDCSSDEFKLFQATVVTHQPKTFDDFEGLLP